MKREVVTMTVLAILTSVVLVSAQTFYHTFNGIRYRWPTAHGTGALTNDGSANPTLSWQSAIPSNMVTFHTGGSCPQGWSAYTTGEGRYLVGLVSGGTNGATGGANPLTNTQNRPSGVHAHNATYSVSLNDPGHGHGITEPNSGQGHSHSQPSGAADAQTLGGLNATGGGGTSGGWTIVADSNPSVANLTPSATVAVTNYGGVTDTNAPYIQYKVCRRN